MMVSSRASIAAPVLLSLFFLSLVLFAPGANASPGKADEYGALRAAGVIHVGTRDEFKGSDDYKALLASGVADASIVDGSMIIVRLLCCRDNVKSSAPAVLYNPQAGVVAEGDIVEFRVGGVRKGETKGEFNVLTRVLQKADITDGACWWEPKNDRLWMRFVYCDWMPKEGWVQQKSMLDPAWYKPADDTGTH